MKKKFIAISILLSLTSPALAEDDTTRSIVNGCRSFAEHLSISGHIESFDEGLCVGEVRASMNYQSGVARILASYRKNKLELPRKFIAFSFLIGFPSCPSKTSSVFDGINYIVRYASEHSEDVNNRPEEFVGKALAEAFPCTPDTLAYYDKN